MGKILADQSGQLIIALHRHDTADGALFRETRTGPGPRGLPGAVPHRLEAWQQHLQEHGVTKAAEANRPLTQSPIADEPYGPVLVFRDPGNIQLELFALPAR